MTHRAAASGRLEQHRERELRAWWTPVAGAARRAADGGGALLCWWRRASTGGKEREGKERGELGLGGLKGSNYLHESQTHCKVGSLNSCGGIPGLNHLNNSVTGFHVL